MDKNKLNILRNIFFIAAIAIPLLLPNTLHDKLDNLIFDFSLTCALAIEVYSAIAFKEFDKTSSKTFLVVDIIILALGVYLTIKNLLSIL